MEYISALKRCKSSRVRFEGGKGRETKAEDEVPGAVSVPRHADPIQGNSASTLPPAAPNTLFPKQCPWSRPWILISHQVTPLLCGGDEPLDICLGRSRSTLTSYLAVVLNSHISGRTNVWPLTPWGSASSLGNTTTFIPYEHDHLPFCGGCSRCGWHSLAEFNREFWAIKKISNAYGWSN